MKLLKTCGYFFVTIAIAACTLTVYAIAAIIGVILPIILTIGGFIVFIVLALLTLIKQIKF